MRIYKKTGVVLSHDGRRINVAVVALDRRKHDLN